MCWLCPKNIYRLFAHIFLHFLSVCVCVCVWLLERKIPESEFGQVIPDVDEYTKEPPILPPHLRHIILNKVRLAKSLLPNCYFVTDIYNVV